MINKTSDNRYSHESDKLALKLDILKDILSKKDSSGEGTINPQALEASSSPANSCAFSVNVENLN